MSIHKTLKTYPFKSKRKTLKRYERVKRLIEQNEEKPDSVFGLPKDIPEDAKESFSPQTNDEDEEEEDQEDLYESNDFADAESKNNEEE